MPDIRRPASVIIPVVLDILLGALILLTQAAAAIRRALLPGIYPPIRGFPALGATYLIVSVVVAVIDFILAYGLWTGKRLAWYFSFAFSLLGIVVVGFALFVRPRTGEVVSLVIDVVIVCLLMQPGVQRYFMKGAGLATGQMQVPKPGVS